MGDPNMIQYLEELNESIISLKFVFHVSALFLVFLITLFVTFWIYSWFYERKEKQ